MKILLIGTVLTLIAQASGYYSQVGQDRYFHENIFKGAKTGVFVDIGAHDGITLSNTKFFEELGWTGICIEPMPEAFEKLKENRSCFAINCCISQSSEPVEFIRVYSDFVNNEMLSGMVSGYDEKNLKRLHEMLDIFGGGYEKILVPSRRLCDVLREAGIKHIDFLSVDVEGVELDVLKSIDFDQVTIRYMTVENNFDDDMVRTYLKEKGYVYFDRLEQDDMYMSKKEYQECKHSKRASLFNGVTAVQKIDKDMIDALLPENSIIVEAGSFNGDDTQQMALKWRHATIHAFEPMPDAFLWTQNRCDKLANVKTYNLALSDREGIADFFVSGGDVTTAASSLLEPNTELIAHYYPSHHVRFENQGSVKMETLERWAHDNTVDRIDLMWLDAQGAEPSIIRGAGSVINTVKVIFSEVNVEEIYKGCTMYKEFKKELETKGFIVLKEEPVSAGQSNVLFVKKEWLDHLYQLDQRH